MASTRSSPRTDLCELAIKYGSDKVPELGHGYTPVYHKYLGKRRKKVQKVLEIGIGYPELMQHVPGYRTGASLYVWRDYFPNATIYAIDTEPSSIIQKHRIECRLCDQGSKEQLQSLIDEIGGGFDLIVDDGSHRTDHQITSATFLKPYLALGGMYFIEDVKEPRWVAKTLGGKVIDLGQEGFPSKDNCMVLLR